MKLYEIDEQIESCVDSETGEIIDEEKLKSLQMEKAQKIENIGLWLKDLRAEKEALKAEKESFVHREKVVANKIESLKSFLSSYLDGKKFKTAKVSVSYRKSESVNITDEESIPLSFKIHQPDKIDKMSLKKALKAGAEIDGASLVETSNIQIR